MKSWAVQLRSLLLPHQLPPPAPLRRQPLCSSKGVRLPRLPAAPLSAATGLRLAAPSQHLLPPAQRDPLQLCKATAGAVRHNGKWCRMPLPSRGHVGVSPSMWWATTRWRRTAAAVPPGEGSYSRGSTAAPQCSTFFMNPCSMMWCKQALVKHQLF